MFMPPMTAAPASPFSSAVPAKCVATREDEQAVSVETQGPVNPKAYDNLGWQHKSKFPSNLTEFQQLSMRLEQSRRITMPVR